MEASWRGVPLILALMGEWTLQRPTEPRLRAGRNDNKKTHAWNMLGTRLENSMAEQGSSLREEGMEPKKNAGPGLEESSVSKCMPHRQAGLSSDAQHPRRS